MNITVNRADGTELVIKPGPLKDSEDVRVLVEAIALCYPDWESMVITLTKP